MARVLGALVASVILALSLVGSAAAWAEPPEPRLWSDSTGKFRVLATLHARTDTSVMLHTADGREISVPVDRLSEKDQGYLAALDEPSDNPFGGGRPLDPRSGKPKADAPSPTSTAVKNVSSAAVKRADNPLRSSPPSPSAGDVLALPGTGTTVDPESDALGDPFVPDPLPESATLPGGSVSVSPVDAYDKVAPPVIVDPAGGIALVSIGRNKSGSPEETRGRIYRVDLASTRSELVWDKPSAVRLVDHDRPSGHTLIVDELDQFGRGGELVVVQGFDSGSPRPLYRRQLPGAGKPGFQPQVQWGRMLSGSHAAIIVDGTLFVWDLAAANLLYRMDQVSAAEPPALSGNFRYLAVPQSKRIVILETATGQLCKSIATGSTLKPGLAFHPNGRLLAASYSNQYQVWDCLEGEPVSQATTTDHLGSAPIDWIGNKTFRTQTGCVVHAGLGMPIWKYTLSGCTDPAVHWGRLITATTSSRCSLVSVGLPHEAAEQSVERLMKSGDAAMLVRPGSAVALAVEDNVGADRNQVLESLSAAVARAGWKVSSEAPITLVARIGRGEPQQLRFRDIRGGPRDTSTATLTPFTADLEIRKGSQVLWSRSTVNRVPMLLRLEEGETVQDAVKRYEKPDPSFFSRLHLPPRIPKPEVSETIGRSVLRDGRWSDLPPARRDRRKPG